MLTRRLLHHTPRTLQVLAVRPATAVSALHATRPLIHGPPEPPRAAPFSSFASPASASASGAGLPAAPAGRRVVITGIGLVSPLGCDVNTVYQRLLAGESAVATVKNPAITALKLPVTVAASVSAMGASCTASTADTAAAAPVTSATPVDTVVASPSTPSAAAAPVIGDSLPAALRAQLSPFEIFAAVAADAALADASIIPADMTEDQRDRTGVAIGSGIGCVEETAAAARTLTHDGPRGGPRRLSPYTLPKMLANLAGGQVSIRHGLRGPNHCVSTACTSGAHAVGDAFRFIKYGDADVMLAGGTEAGVSPLSLALFSRIMALSTCADPAAASRPFAASRDGFVMGEGAAVLVLEEEERARARGARVYAEIVGYGLSGDAHHITSPPADGRGAAACMRNALRNAGVPASAVDYVNAHATSTPLGDRAEAAAFRAVFTTPAAATADAAVAAADANTDVAAAAASADTTMEKSATPSAPVCRSGPLLSSTKGAVGHMLGAAGAFEAAVVALAVHTGRAPPTTTVSADLDPAFADLRVLTPDNAAALAAERQLEKEPGSAGIEYALSNSFAFGGSNASVLLKKYRP